MIQDAARLAGALRGLVDRFGPAVLEDPVRVRNLLLDEYGADSRVGRSDIDALVGVLSLQIPGTEPLELAATQVMAATGLPADDAKWAVSTVRSVSHLEPAPTVITGSGGHDRVTAPPTVVVDERAPEPAGRGKWPVLAGVVVAVLGLVAIGLAVFGFVMQSSLSDKEAEMDAAQEELDALGEQSGERAQTLAEQIDDLTSSREALEGQLAEESAAKTEAQQELAAMGQSFVASTGEIGPIADHYTGPLTAGDCAGFGNNAEACDNLTPYYVDAQFVDDGQTLTIHLTDISAVPLSSFDGIVYGGSAAGQSLGTKCKGVELPSTVAVTLLPVTYAVDPTTDTIAVEEYGVTLAINWPAAGCTPASVNLRGVLSAG